MSDIKKAANIKLIGRLYNSNTVWAMWMQERYLFFQSFAQAIAYRSDSGIWKWICSSKNEALMCMTRKLGNGWDTCCMTVEFLAADWLTLCTKIQFQHTFMTGH